jgi:hypothetical protein
MEESMKSSPAISSFNTPLESGIRTLGVLVAAYPEAYDLQKLVVFDFMVVHSGDMNGPESLHPNLPLRSKELLIRRQLIENGLLLMMSRNLIERLSDGNGFTYKAAELSETFLDSLTSQYLIKLRSRAVWAVGEYGSMEDESLRLTTRGFVETWIEEFQIVQKSLGA